MNVVILVIDPGDADGFGIAAFVDDFAAEVVCNFTTVAQEVHIDPSLSARAKQLQDNLNEVYQLGVFLEVFHNRWILVDIAQPSGQRLHQLSNYEVFEVTL